MRISTITRRATLALVAGLLLPLATACGGGGEPDFGLGTVRIVNERNDYVAPDPVPPDYEDPDAIVQIVVYRPPKDPWTFEGFEVLTGGYAEVDLPPRLYDIQVVWRDGADYTFHDVDVIEDGFRLLEAFGP